MAKARNPIKEKLNKSLAKHAQDETTASQEYIDLPPGIQGGIATLVEAKLGVYQSGDNEGKQFIYLAGVVVEPIEHTYNPRIFINGKVETQEAVTVRVQGQRTSLMIPWCDTTNSKGKTTSADEHVADSLNRLRQLGADTSDVQTEDDLEVLMKALIEVAPVFKFGTRASNPNAQYPTSTTWESWYGSEGLEDYESPDEDEVVDETEEGDSEKEEPEEDPEGEEDLETLGDEADAEEGEGDEEVNEARTRLTELAEENSIDPDKFDSWAEVATAIDEATQDDEVAPPEVDEVWQYKPPKKRKYADVVVTSVSSSKETVNLKNLEDGKTLYKEVPWSKLQAPEDE